MIDCLTNNTVFLRELGTNYKLMIKSPLETSDHILCCMVFLKTMSVSGIQNDLVSEIGLTPVQAKVYLLVTCHGKMSSKFIAEKLQIPAKHAENAARDLMTLGAFIDITPTEFEAMHPRFTAVNMYRRMCERKKIVFTRNKIVDSMGAVLEKPYDDVRTK